MLKKKTGGKRVNCFLYIVHRAPEKMSKMFAKKVSKEGAKGQDRKPRMPILQGFPRFPYARWLYFGACEKISVN